MTDQEIAAQIVDKYWKESGFTEPNPYLLEADIAKALRSVRQEENEACAKVASEYHYGKLGIVRVLEASAEIATAIRNRMKEKP